MAKNQKKFNILKLFKRQSTRSFKIKHGKNIISQNQFLETFKKGKQKPEDIKILEKILRKLHELHIKNKKMSAIFYFGIIAILIIAPAVGLITSFIFPAIFKSNAASYLWRQESWQGGASENYASHELNRTGWDKYGEKDASIIADSKITAATTTSSINQTSDSSFSAGVLTDVAISGMGANANIVLDSVSSLDWIGESYTGGYDTPGYAYDIKVSGDYAYVADYGSGLQILNISDPANPSLTGSYDTSGFSYAIAISGNYAYIADGSYGLQVINISDPAHPGFVKNYNTAGTSYGIFAANHYVYVADDDHGLLIFDVSDPLNPTVAGTYDTAGHATAVSVSGDYAYVTDGTSGLEVINISDPAHPSLAGACDTPNYANDISIEGNYAYIADGSSGLQVINISNPSSPIIDGSYNTFGYSYRIYAYDSHVYLSDGADGVVIVNVSNPANPSYAGVYESADTPRGIYVSDGYAYITAYTAGLQIINISALKDVYSFDAYDTAGYSYGVRSEGNLAYLADGVGGLAIFDVSNPSVISLLGTCDTPDLARDLVLSGDYAYVADNTSGIQVIDISNSATPTIIGNYNTAGSAYNIIISGGYGYVADGNSGLVILNVSDPAHPSLAGSYDTTGTAYGVYVSGNYAYIADGTSGLVILNISDPAHPSLAGSYDTAGTAYDIYVQGDYAYAADGNSGLQIINIADASHPAFAGSHSTINTANSVYISGNYAYIGATTAGPEIINIADPTHIFFVGILNTISTTRDFYASGNFAYVADGASGIRVISTGYYLNSGAFLSSSIDTNQNNYLWNNISWNADIPADTQIILRAKTSETSTVANVESCNPLGTITPSNSAGSFTLAGNGCITAGHRYIKYHLTLSTSNPYYSAALRDLSIAFDYYPSLETITSSAYDISGISGAIGSIMWEEEILAGCDAKFKIRTAPDNAGAPGDWSDWMGPESVNDFYTNFNGQETINSSHTDGVDDGWFQYKLFLYSNNITAPSVDNITVNYAANAAPEIQNTVAAQNSDGTVSITYEVKDSDTSSGTNTPGEITPSFEYWNETSWISCAAMEQGDVNNKEVLEDSFTSYTAIWNPKTDFNNQFLDNKAKIKITINDNELANKFAYGESNTFTLDTAAPSSVGISVIASTTPARVILSATDASALQMKISLNETFDGAVWQDFSSLTSITLVTNPDTVYAQFKDTVNNTASIISATTPQATEDMIIRDVSNKDNSDFRLFIGWKNSAIADFKRYNIYYSTDGSNYALLDTIADAAVNYYVHQSLNDNFTYYYKINVEDLNNNVSFCSDILSDRPDGQGGTDNTAPLISDVATSSISATMATITWQTDELSNSTVGYSVTPAQFTSEKGVVSMLNNHSVIITSLLPDTTYYFQVKSVDPSNNIALDDNGDNGYSFTTLGGPIISNVSAAEIKNTNSKIVWDTDIESDSYVVYSVNSNLSESAQTGNDTPSKFHSIVLSPLIHAKKYYYYVKSTDGDGGMGIDNNGGSYHTFTTTSDITGPAISAITADLITDNAAVIGWATDESATSKVDYGLASGAYTISSPLNSNLDATHSVNLSSLSVNTKYYYIVISKDGSDNTSTSTEQTFTTLEKLSTEEEVEERENTATDNARQSASGGGILIIDKTDKIPPVISDVKISNLKMDSATVNWKTGEEAKYNFVEFRPAKPDNMSYMTYGSYVAGKDHLVNLKLLTPATVYSYKVLSADESGNLSGSKENTFTTLATSTLEMENKEGMVLGESTAHKSEEKLLAAKNESEENIFIAAAKKAIDFINNNASNISIGVLEETITNQYESLKNIAKLIPSPLLKSEPKITVSSDTALISWGTDKESNSLVSFSEDGKFKAGTKNPYTQTIGNPDESIKDHSVMLYNLKPETTYHYQIISAAPLGQETKSQDFTFRTKSEILEITVYSFQTISKRESIFKWTTNLEADSRIKYTPYKNNILAIDEIRYKNNDKLALDHEISIDGFEEGVTYEVELSSKNINGKTAVKTISSFRAGKDNSPPVIYQVQSESALLPGKSTKVQTIISWFTDEPSTGQIYYDEGINPANELSQETTLDSNYTKKHVAVITKFEPGKIYTYKIRSMDYSGNEGLSKTFSILIPQQQESVLQVILKNLEKTFGWLGKMRK